MFFWAQADAIVGGKSTNTTTLLASMMLRKYGDRSNCLNAGCIKTNSVKAWNTQPTISRTTMLVPNPKNSPSLSEADISPSDWTTFSWAGRWIHNSVAFDADEILYCSVVSRSKRPTSLHWRHRFWQELPVWRQWSCFSIAILKFACSFDASITVCRRNLNEQQPRQRNHMIPPVWRAFSKLRFRGGLVWMVGVAIETKLRFQISTG